MKWTTRIVFVMLMASTQGAWAQDSSSGASAGQIKKVKLDLDELVYTGNVEKPQVQYSLSREKIRDITPLDLEESFLGKVVKAVEKKPF